MHCSDPASEVVPVGQIEHFVMLELLNVPGIQEQLSDPAVDVENVVQGEQAEPWWFLYVCGGQRLHEALVLLVQVQAIPVRHVQIVPFFTALDPNGHATHWGAPSWLTETLEHSAQVDIC